MRFVQLSVVGALALIVSGCGGAGGATADAGTVLVAAAGTGNGSIDAGAGNTTADADPELTPIADVDPTETALGTGEQASATAQGTQPETTVTPTSNYVYPAIATISLKPVSYSETAKDVNVQVSLDRATPHTVIAHVVTSNGSINKNFYTPVDTYVTFYPGDPLTQTVRVPIVKFKAGGTFNLSIPETPQGANKGVVSVQVTAAAGAAATPAINGSRAPRSYAPNGVLKYQMNTATMKWSSDGSDGVWRTQMNHGRSQVQNGETGLYLDDTVYPQTEKPIRIVDGNLVLHTSKLAQPITYSGNSSGYGAGTFNYGAVVLSGLRMPQTQIAYGAYEWTAKMPTRMGAWPALWLVGVKGWPPEIDVFEGMSYIPNWDLQRTIWNSIHGGPVNKQTFAPGAQQPSKLYGVPNLSDSFHQYAVTIDQDYITFFLDGKETWQVVNMFNGEGKFFPLMSVGVKTTGAYDTGNPNMVISSFKVFEKP